MKLKSQLQEEKDKVLELNNLLRLSKWDNESAEKLLQE